MGNNPEYCGILGLSCHMFEIILFDLDGTISDSKEGVTKCTQYALSHFGIEVSDLRQLERFVGPPINTSFVEFYGFNEEDNKKAVALFRERYTEKGKDEHKIYSGMAEAIRALHDDGRVIALATSKLQHFAEAILEEYGIRDCFNVVIGSTLDGTRITKTEVISEIFRILSIDGDMLNRTVIIGDRKYDVEGAKECGISSICVRHGCAEEGELEEAGADYIVETPEELLSLLRKK